MEGNLEICAVFPEGDMRITQFEAVAEVKDKQRCDVLRQVGTMAVLGTIAPWWRGWRRGNHRISPKP
jgi:hypothetical protein